MWYVGVLGNSSCGGHANLIFLNNSGWKGYSLLATGDWYHWKVVGVILESGGRAIGEWWASYWRVADVYRRVVGVLDSGGCVGK